MPPSVLPCILVAWRTTMPLGQCSLSKAHPPQRCPGRSIFALGHPYGMPSAADACHHAPRTRRRRRKARQLLAPRQNLDGVGTFLLPRLDFILQGAPNIEREYLTEADRIIRRSAKIWMNFPQRASAEWSTSLPRKGEWDYSRWPTSTTSSPWLTVIACYMRVTPHYG